MNVKHATYLFVGFLVTVVGPSLLIVVVFVVLVVEIELFVVFHFFSELLKLKSLTGEPVNGTWNQLLLDIFTELVVEL